MVTVAGPLYYDVPTVARMQGRKNPENLGFVQVKIQEKEDGNPGRSHKESRGTPKWMTSLQTKPGFWTTPEAEYQLHELHKEN